MTRLRLLLLTGLALLALGAVNVACGDDGGDDDDGGRDFPAEVQLTQDDDGATVRLALDGELIVALPSNVTTGFSWAVGEASDDGLVLQGEPRYVPPGSTTPVAGAPGTEVLTFGAESPGTSRLVLEYRRPFEPDAEPEQTFTVTVEIR